VINHDGRPTIVDTPLTLNFMMGQGAFHLLFCLSRQPKLHWWLFETCHTPDCARYTTNNHWRSVDGHSHDGTGTVFQFVLPIKPAKNSFMTVCNLSAVWVPRKHDPQSWKLHLRSFSSWVRDGFAICFPNKGGQKCLYDWLQLMGGVITQHAWTQIVHALLKFIFRMR